MSSTRSDTNGAGPTRAGALGRARTFGRLLLGSMGGRREPGEPPLVAGKIPFLGCGAEFARDATAFLSAQRREHGDVFTIYMAGRRTTFLLDPHDYPTVFKRSDDLDFHEIATAISANAFGHTLGTFHAVEDTVNRLSIALLRGVELDRLTERTLSTFAAALSGSAALRGSEGTGLYRFLTEVLFAGGGDALFGEGFASSRILDAFSRLDGYFPLLAAGVPAYLLPGCRGAQREISAAFRAPREHESRLVAERTALFAARVSASEAGCLQSSLVWAALANTLPAAFWSLFYLLRDARARGEVEAEIREALGASSGALDAAALGRMPKLDSAISEALRLTAASIVLRRVRRSFSLPLDAGGQVALREGDYLALYPQLTHRDAEIFEAPDDYRFDRFLGRDEGAPFEKHGKVVKYPLVPFGGGVSACPGRHLALRELKLFMALLLSRYEIELGSRELPALDQRRVGLGVLPPRGDVPFRIRERARRVLDRG